jgi:two-component system cell cycle response regulator
VRVLVVDDEATSRVLLKAVVKKLGHECLVAEDGSGAWDLVSREPVDVLLSDWMMPGLDGPQLCRMVREAETSHYTYIVLVTGLGQQDQVLEGMRAGADDYLVKPVNPFAVETRLVAARRVTGLHRQVVEYRTELERVNTELLGLSLTDPLTGLGNRRRMEEDLARTDARARRTQRSFAVTLFDVDHFKLYNDHYGHPAGDEVLRQVAHCLRAVLRQGDTLYRYGGEEFLLILPECGLSDAMIASERCRRAVETASMRHEARPSLPPLVTVSGGSASWSPGASQTPTDLLAEADAALYRAKAAGRNRICGGPIYVGEQPQSPPTVLHS